mmetsp:Transcript_16773/g.40104  ORF Transcript_16773/g.40104 Transcript_16773/m.40104 type:complete len:378 (+) Transcript_16773:86-1219(+)
MTVIKKIGTVVLGMALIIGSIGKFVPHLFMNLPYPLSIIFWASTGNEMPPYFMPEAWKEDEIDTWTRDGDLVVATGVKAGTTWMLYCTHQIRTKGTDVNDELFVDVSISTPWPDLRQSRTGTWAEQKERYNTTILADGRKMKDVWDHPSYPFRIFKSHYSPKVLPVGREGGNKIKYMAMVRNGLDMAASFTNFYSAHTPEFRSLWGGFPPFIPEEAMSADEPPPAVKDILPGGLLSVAYWGYLKEWWPYRNDPHVILLHYSNLRKDLKTNVAKIAKFLEVDLTNDQLDVVSKRCSFEHMKERAVLFKYLLPLNRDKLWDVEKDHLMAVGSMTKEGRLGTGGSLFSKNVVAQWNKAEEDEFGHDPAMLKWAREGGEFP